MTNVAIDALIRSLNRHPSVAKPISEPVKDGIFLVIEFNINVQMPRDAAEKGVTATGIKASEPVRLKLLPSFPFRAPFIELRNDFNRAHPHINPTPPGTPVNPCISELPLDELIQDPGWIDEFINQIAQWLDDAASGELMNCSGQGWEPIRRDEVKSKIVFDPIPIHKHTARMTGPGAHYVGYRYFTDKSLYLAGRLTNLDSPIQAYSNTDALSPFKIISHVGFEQYTSLGLIVWAGRNKITDCYLPDDVIDLPTLFNCAEDYGCKQPLEYRINEILKNVKLISSVLEIMVAIVFVIRRPCKVIGQNNDFEIIPYTLTLPNDGIGGLDIKNSKVNSLGHFYDISKELLSTLSGRDLNVNYNHKPILMAGCGSVGSKICLHLAKSGFNEFRLIDKDLFTPHNNARHGAILGDGMIVHKTELLKYHLGQLNVEVETLTDNIIDSLEPHKNKIFNTSIIIDSTASNAVREALCKTYDARLRTRIVRCELYGKGMLSVISVEGQDRTPRLDDLAVQLYQLGLENDDIGNLIYQCEDHSRVPIGQSCGSFTMTMSDAIVSLHSSCMSQYIQTLLDEGFPNAGGLLIGFTNQLKIGISWVDYKPWTMQVFNIGNNVDNWEVRLPCHLADKMSQKCVASTPNETGGILIGHLSWGRRVITISDIQDPPIDSTMSPRKFILGTHMLRSRILQLENKTGGSLTYLGTWHSHPQGGKASKIDEDTLKDLVAVRGLVPTVCLVIGPDGIHVVPGPATENG